MRGLRDIKRLASPSGGLTKRQPPPTEEDFVRPFQCENCGAFVAAEARFCKHCGHEVDSSSRAPLHDVTLRCPECGRFVGEDDRRCRGCRALLPWHDPLQRPLVGRLTVRQLSLGALAAVVAVAVLTQLSVAVLLLVAIAGLLVGLEHLWRKGRHFSRPVVGAAAGLFLLTAGMSFGSIGEWGNDESRVSSTSVPVVVLAETSSTTVAVPTTEPPTTTSVPATTTTSTEPPTTTTSIPGLQVTLLRVTDGDTIVVKMPNGTEEKVRYIGIDCPEPGDALGMGEKATAYNTRLLAEGALRLEMDVEERDQYGRLLAYVWAGEVFVNRRMVLDGYAQVSTFPPNVAHEGDFLGAQQKASAAEVGLWAPTTTEAVVAEPEDTGSGITVHITRTGEKYHRGGCRYLSRSDIPVSLAEAKARGYDP